MARKEQLSFANDALLFRQRVSFDKLPNVLEQIIGETPRRELRAKLFLSEVSLPEAIRRFKPRTSLSFEIVRQSDEAVSVVLNGRYGRKKNEAITGRFFLINHPKFRKVSVLVTDSGREFFEKPLRKLFKSIRPRPTAPILTTSQLEEIAIALQGQTVTQAIRVTQVGQRARIRSRGAHKQIESDRKWTDLTISEAFGEAHEAGQWVTDVVLEYPGRAGKKMAARIGRYGDIVFKRSCQVAFPVVVDLASEYAERRYEFLKNRHRSSETGYQSKPFQIEFNFPALSTLEQVQTLATVLKRIPVTTCTILHGNPYFHAVMVDYRDGSVYEILVISQSSITIIPQGRSTVRSLQRLCAQVFSGFREGELRDV